MPFYMVVRKPFKHQIDCFCPYEEHSDFFQFDSGDIIEVTRERKYVSGVGWYFLLIINNKYSYYTSINDIEAYYEEQKICSLLDLELEINCISFQVDQALDMKKEQLFSRSAMELTKLKQLYNVIGACHHPNFVENR